MNKRFILSLVSTSLLLSADTLYLRNGNRVDGTFIGGDSRGVRFAAGTQVNTYSLNDIDSIRFSSGAPAAAYPQGSAPPPPPPGYSQSGAPPTSAYPQTSGNYPPPGPPNGPGADMSALEIPAGTQIVVRLIDGIDSTRDRLGQTYRASVDQPVTVNGQTVVPRGADVIAALIDAEKSGKIQGRTSLTVDLKALTVNGRTYDIVSTSVSEASGSRGERSAKVIGGTAALGAVIGAIAGGGRGAAIGAGSGAAVGTAAQVMTSGQTVKVPAETRLTFTLQNSLRL
jgi:hypothetical protein